MRSALLALCLAFGMSASAQHVGVHVAAMPTEDIGTYNGVGGEMVFGKTIMINATYAELLYKENLGGVNLRVNSNIWNVGGGIKLIDRFFIKGGALISWTKVSASYNNGFSVTGSTEQTESVTPTFGFKYMSKYLVSFGVDAMVSENSYWLFSLGVNI